MKKKPWPGCHKEMTLADHAEEWWKDQGNRVPPKTFSTDDQQKTEWEQMYLAWWEFAFNHTDLRIGRRKSWSTSN